MKVIAGNLLVGQAFKLNGELYIPLSSSGSKIVAIKSDFITLIPYNIVVETAYIQLNGKEYNNEKED